MADLTISDDVKESVYANLERALDYVQDYINIRGCSTMDELQQDAIECSPTDMAEVYGCNDEDDVSNLSFEDAQVRLYTYAIYNVGYHCFEGITWDVPDEQMPIFENSHLYDFYKEANILVDGLNATIENPKLKTRDYIDYISFCAGHTLYLGNKEYKDLLETTIKTFMDSFYNFVQYFKKPGEFERYIKMWREDTPTKYERWAETKLFMQEQETKPVSNQEIKELIGRLIEQTKPDSEIYQKVENAKKIEDILALIPLDKFTFKTVEELKLEFKTQGIKYNFKKAKAYVLAKYLHIILEPYFNIKPVVTNLHPSDAHYFNYMRVAPLVSDFMISLLTIDESEYRAKITEFALANTLSTTRSNGKHYAWTPIHIAPNLKNPEGVDLILTCLNWNRSGFMMIPFMLNSRRYLNCYF